MTMDMVLNLKSFEMQDTGSLFRFPLFFVQNGTKIAVHNTRRTTKEKKEKNILRC